MKCYIKIMLSIMLFIFSRTICAETLSHSMNINLAVNIAPPVCKLTEANQTVDFGDIQVSDIISGKAKRMAGFVFSDCKNVNDVTISFSGNYIDQGKNIVKNKSGGASGVAIELYDDKESRLQLKDKKKISINYADSFYFNVMAVVVADGSGERITPGDISSSIDLNVTYS